MLRRAVLVLGVSLLGAAVLSGVVGKAAPTPRSWTMHELDGLDADVRGMSAGGLAVGSHYPGVAVLWDARGAHELRMPADMFLCAARAVNDTRQVVGSCSSETLPTEPAVVWLEGKPSFLLPLPRAVSAEPHDINRSGLIVGVSGSRAALWTVSAPGRPQALPTPQGWSSTAHAISDQGEIVGSISKGRRTRAVLWRSRRLTYLPSLGGANAAAVDVDSQQRAVGWSLDARGRRHGVRWIEGRAIDLGTQISPLATNDRGEIVGECRRASTARPSSSACVWAGGITVILPFSVSGALGSGATGIDRRGVVVGNGSFSDSYGYSRAYAWRPRP